MKKRMRNRRKYLAAVMTAAACAFSLQAGAGAQALEDTESLWEYEEGYETEEEAYSREMAEGVSLEESEADQTPEDTEMASVSMENMPFYFFDLDHEAECPVYFINGVKDLPYLNLSDCVKLMLEMNAGAADGKYDLKLETDGQLAQVTRENGYTMLVDFEQRTISFDDYDAFIKTNGDTSLLDEVSNVYTDQDGNPILLEKVEKGSFDRYGKEIELDLAAYQISLFWSEVDGLYLVPLQTLADFLLSPVSNYRSFFFNTQAVYCADSDEMGMKAEEYTPLGESYYGVEAPDRMSDELAMYSYCELCLALDNLYGLKEIHDITGFDRVFSETGYREDLQSADPDVKDGALIDFINYYLDDMHSGFTDVSYMTKKAESIGGKGLAARRDTEVSSIYYAARANADQVIESYQEIGNTAYVTFDEFISSIDPSEYYTGSVDVDADPESGTLQTAALLIYAHEQITRQNSPIENVVIDLSLNGGGALDAAAATAAWFLGEASINIKSSMTGAISTGTYRLDANLDGVFDEQDTLGSRKLFCLMSPYSFSCGNLVPNIFRSSGRVTLLGKESGGGSCVVLPMSTAYGSMFQISSSHRMSYMKNGSYYDTDTGILPDCVIVRPENYYDREALTEYINHLF